MIGPEVGLIVTGAFFAVVWWVICLSASRAQRELDSSGEEGVGMGARALRWSDPLADPREWGTDLTPREFELPIAMRRGALTDQRPTLWLCTRCGYSYWSHGDDQDPPFYLIESQIYGGHCRDNKPWIPDERAIDWIAEEPWRA